MARGPKKTPAAIAAAKGNPSRRRVVKDPAAEGATGSALAGQVKIAGVAPPTWLDGEARNIWDMHAPIMHQLKLLTDADINAFGRYCQNMASWIAARKDLLENGMTYEVTSAHGSWIRKNPAFDQMHALEIDLQRAEDRFGMNPAERQRIFSARAAGATGGAGDGLPLQGGRDHAEDKLKEIEAASPGDNGQKRSPVGYLN